jgi:hypothetical protein
MSTYYGCPGCQTGGAAGHICGLGLANTTGGNVYSNITWTANTIGGSCVTCGSCGNLISQCSCCGKYTWQPYPANPYNPTSASCPWCNQFPCQCSYVQPTPYPSVNPITLPNTGGISSTPWQIFTSILEWIHNIKLIDIQTDETIKKHDSLLTILSKTPEKGFLGTLEYLTLPSLFQNYFVKVGKDESSSDIWYMISPLMFRLIAKDQNKKETSHMVVVLGVKNLELEETKEETTVHLKKVRLLEIKDNLTFMQLVERDKAYRKHLLK